MLIIGDNPFFGVNHASAERAKSYYSNTVSGNWGPALSVLTAARTVGIDSFMLTTHANAPDLLRSMQRDNFLRDFKIIPAVPYLHRVNGLVAAKGIFHAGIRSISYLKFLEGLVRLRGAKVSALYAFIEKELEAVVDLNFAIEYVALQNIFVDLLISLDLGWVINKLGELVNRRGRCLVPITMNPVLADKVLDSALPICTNYNYLGYLVQPNLIDFNSFIVSRNRRVWAMGVMSSGAAEKDKVFSDPILPEFDSVVFGSSRVESVLEFGERYAAVRR